MISMPLSSWALGVCPSLFVAASMNPEAKILMQGSLVLPLASRFRPLLCLS